MQAEVVDGCHSFSRTCMKSVLLNWDMFICVLVFALSFAVSCLFPLQFSNLSKQTYHAMLLQVLNPPSFSAVKFFPHTTALHTVSVRIAQYCTVPRACMVRIQNSA